MTDKKPPLILVDGSSYLFRAFHALPRLTNSKGQDTGAVYGVINMLNKLVEEYKPEHIAVVFDAKGKTFRNDLYEAYKANRPPMPDELRSQIEPLHEIVEALGYPIIVVPGVEADDVIGTYAKQATEKNIDTLISTGDKDLAQLVNEHVTLINTMNNVVLDEGGVVDKFDVPPAAIIDYLALMGDTSDNIPGVPKVGPKTAAKWLKQYETLDNLVAHADEIKGKVGESLRDNLEQLPLSRELTTIKCDVELDHDIAELAMREPQLEKLKQMYTDLEFKTWLSNLSTEGKEESSSPATSKSSYETVLDKKSFDRWIKKLNKAKQFAFDTETTSLDYMQAKVVGVSFAVKAGEAAYVPFAHDYLDAPAQLSEQDVLGALKPMLEDKDKGKIGQNLKYDAHVLNNHGISMQGIAQDTMLESYVLDSTQRHNMDDMAFRLLGHSTIHFEDIAGKGAKQLTFNQVDLALAGPYAAEDADITLQIHDRLSQALDAEPALKKVYEEIELPLLDVLLKIERNGVKVDVAMLDKQSEQLAQRMKEVEQLAYDEAGESFNLASPKQLSTILFEKLKIPSSKKTKTGQYSTAEDVLQELAAEYALPKLLLEHRSLSKLKSTYTDKLPLQVNEKTGRVHTSYNQTVAATGRLSSTDPNLQNIPVRSEEGRRIRQAFVAPKGHKLLAADYSQVELRIMAHLSEDASLLKAFADGVDVHRATASEVFGVALDEVEAEQRRAAKAINFGLIYGMSAFGLAKQLNIGRYEAQDYIDVYFARYPGVKEYMDKTRAQAHDRGYVETVFGRRLYLPEINSRNGQRRQYAERTAINAPMQGTAADIIKRAMISVDKALTASKVEAKVVMQVHDELVVEVVESDIESAADLLRVEMEQAAELKVPLVVDIGIGDNWDEAH
ncbi:MAG: DNA polymerase I [Gammaproteobacteria bacterium]|nr:DNA polymerase I [Gammaproteobacteria bacterium]NNJ48813.1 DNA polymerase I [Gammaproteobacteria bacterium]